VCRARNDDGAIDDVMLQPRLSFGGPPAGVDGVAGSEILGATQDSGCRGAVGTHVGTLGPVATALERIGRQFEPVPWLMVQRGELRAMPGDICRGQRLGDLVLGIGTLAQR